MIDAWPTLPEAIRAGIVAMVEAASGEPALSNADGPGRSGCPDHADGDGGKGKE